MLFTSDVCMQNCFSHVWPCVTLWTVACQAPLFIGFSRQEYSIGLPWPPPEDLLDLGIEPASLMLLHWQAGSLVPPGKRPTSGIVLNRSHIDWRTIWYVWVILYRLMLLPCFLLWILQWLPLPRRPSLKSLPSPVSMPRFAYESSIITNRTVFDYQRCSGLRWKETNDTVWDSE